ncbi:MAG: PilZ domain-containing protein [Smithella sp.]
MMRKNDERQTPRYKVKVPVEFESGRGFTQNCSASGVYFITEKSFSLGQDVEYTLFLEHIDAAGPVRLKCQGKVVRVEKNGKKMGGVAATINSYSLEMFEPMNNN